MPFGLVEQLGAYRQNELGSRGSKFRPPMSRYFRFFGLERDPFLDTADPYFYCELGNLRRAKDRLVDSVDASRGLTVVLGEPATGKTSLSGALEQELLADERMVLGKVLDPTFA